ncbi:hypothetical protein P7K49_003048 [Saguinus oedipus]|uniref:Proline dehydrogenase n=1 Tax=Saguinus oedipus TaxID=9490 RepID=A0ABQ9WJ31_SAGOE|nr:hypothetical protein P7K49_003048 [Saguinus oedipus]
MLAGPELSGVSQVPRGHRVAWGGVQVGVRSTHPSNGRPGSLEHMMTAGAWAAPTGLSTGHTGGCRCPHFHFPLGTEVGGPSSTTPAPGALSSTSPGSCRPALDAYDNVTLDVELARREGWCFGSKLVWGAYMAQERARAAEMGYEDPINPTYKATNAMYHRCAVLPHLGLLRAECQETGTEGGAWRGCWGWRCPTLLEPEAPSRSGGRMCLDHVLEELKHNAKAKVMVATHNKDSVRFTLCR